LGYNQKNNLFVHAFSLRVRVADRVPCRLPLPPEPQIEHGKRKRPSSLKNPERPHLFRESGDCSSRERFEIAALVGFRNLRINFRQQGGTRNVFVLFALRQADSGHLYLGILFKGQPDGFLQGQPQNRSPAWSRRNNHQTEQKYEEKPWNARPPALCAGRTISPQMRRKHSAGIFQRDRFFFLLPENCCNKHQCCLSECGPGPQFSVISQGMRCG